MSRKLTQSEWIGKAIAKHGSKYDYSKIEYVNSRSMVIVVCREHGEWEQVANDHLRGAGCPTCAKSDTQNSFLKKARLVHGKRYDYSISKYKGSHEYISIRCKKHGIFKMKAYLHLQGKGCKTCSTESRSKKRLLGIDRFVEKADVLHQGKYDYSRVRYISSKTKVEIICNDHGVFMQTPNMHLKGNGCPSCGVNKKTLLQFIKDAKKVHGNKYDYSKTVYDGSEKDVVIICKKHGPFIQRAGGHLAGYGCKACSESSGEKIIRMCLNQLGWKYEAQKHIYDNKSHAPLRLDFYIPAINAAIEYHGRQHYEPIDFFGGKTRYQVQKERDNRKREYCTKYNIRLIEIPYSKKDKIAEILLNEIGAYRCEEMKSVSFSGIGIQQRLF